MGTAASFLTFHRTTPTSDRVHQQYYDIARETGDRNGEANSLFNLAIAFAKLKRRPEALQNYQQAQQI